MPAGVGPVGLAAPRDRAGTSGPLLVPRRAGRVADGLDDMIISRYAHGMSGRDILHQLEQVYGTKLPAETVARITGGVLEEARAGQARPPGPAWAVAFPAAIVGGVRDSHAGQDKPACLAAGVDGGGEKARAGHLGGQDRRRRRRRRRAPGSGGRSRPA